MPRPKRTTALLLGFALALVVPGVATFYALFDEAVRVGEAARASRNQVARQLEKPVPRRSRTVFLGDSTLLPHPGVPAYPRLLKADVVPRGTKRDTRIVALRGLDPFHAYYVMGAVLEKQPDLVVLTAQLRLLESSAPVPRNELCEMLPIGELWGSLGVPLEVRGLTLPKRLLCPLLRFESVRKGIAFVDGLRRTVRGSPAWGPQERPAPKDAASKDFWSQTVDGLRAYDRPVPENAPSVRMLGAAVEMATRTGVRVLVVLHPIPIDLLRRADLYGAKRYADRVDLVRRTTLANGGSFLDLHDALAFADFRDAGGHYKRRGAERVAALVAPHIAELLDPDRARAQ